MKVRKDEMMGPAMIEVDRRMLQQENEELKRYNLALQGELYGARLAAKYLDKELAGRFVSI
jgi:hypothetical protein